MAEGLEPGPVIVAIGAIAAAVGALFRSEWRDRQLADQIAKLDEQQRLDRKEATEAIARAVHDSALGLTGVRQEMHADLIATTESIRDDIRVGFADMKADFRTCRQIARGECKP